MLKTWDGIRTGYREQLSASTTVCIADNDVGFGHDRRLWLCLVQNLTHPVRANLRAKYHGLLTTGSMSSAVGDPCPPGAGDLRGPSC
jgi:hypothetical protein